MPDEVVAPELGLLLGVEDLLVIPLVRLSLDTTDVTLDGLRPLLTLIAEAQLLKTFYKLHTTYSLVEFPFLVNTFEILAFFL